MRRFHVVSIILLSFLIAVSEPAISWPFSKKACPDPLDSISDVDKKLLENFDSSFLLDPETVEKMDSRTLAKMIINRIHNNCDSRRDPKKVKSDDDASEIVMLVPDKYLGSIAANGFKNQHQTSVTGGANNKLGRLIGEDDHAMIAFPYSNSSRELLAKYALQVFKDPKMGDIDLPTSYGNVLVRFKPEVRDRATWSDKNSLGFAETLRTNQLRPFNGQACLQYCEAQIWGALDISDVKSISIPKGMQITDEMKSMGVPIYEYENCLGGYDMVTGQPRTPGPVCKSEPREKNALSKSERESSRPVYTPPPGYKQPAPLAPDLQEIETNLKTESNPVNKALLNSRRLQLSSTDALVNELKATDPSLKPSPTDSYSYYNRSESLGSTHLRILAELAARPKTDELNQTLIDAYKATTDASEKAVILGGLSKLDPSILKPMVIESLNGQGILGKVARALAIQMRSDDDVHKALERDLAGNQMLSKVEKDQLCEAEPHD